LLAPVPGELVLDLGCGDGTLTLRLKESGCDVIGIDSSPEQVGAARNRKVDARVMSAEALRHSTEFVSKFDAAFSNAVLHWVRDAAAAMAGVHRALKPGGRFVAEFGGHGNIETIRQALHRAMERRGHDPAAHDPWTFLEPEEYRAVLEGAGFEVATIALVARPTPLPTGMEGWLATFAQSFTAALAPDERGAFVQEVCEAARPVLYRQGEGWFADYVRLRLTARKRAEPG